MENHIISSVRIKAGVKIPEGKADILLRGHGNQLSGKLHIPDACHCIKPLLPAVCVAPQIQVNVSGDRGLNLRNQFKLHILKLDYHIRLTLSPSPLRMWTPVLLDKPCWKP